MSREDAIRVIIHDVITCGHIDYDLALRHNIEISEIWDYGVIIGIAVEDEEIYY